MIKASTLKNILNSWMMYHERDSEKQDNFALIVFEIVVKAFFYINCIFVNKYLIQQLNFRTF
jgi:hypothetical protein